MPSSTSSSASGTLGAHCGRWDRGRRTPRARVPRGASRSGVRRDREDVMAKKVLGRRLFAIVAAILGATAACGARPSAPIDEGDPESQDGAATLPAVADGGGGGDSTGEPVDGTASDASEAGPGQTDAGSFACGPTTCEPGQVCVQPCCGGAAPSCSPVPTLGGCPSDRVMVSACPGSGQPGCQTPPCHPDTPYCVDRTSQCTEACTCGAAECRDCQAFTGNDIICRCG